MATALVTGASQGIGACLIKRLARDGFNAAINCYPSESDRKNAESVKAECEAFGIRAEIYEADVSKHSDCEEMVKKIKADFGTIDVLVNNAGITRDGLMVRMSEEQYDAVIAVNQKSAFNMMKFVSTVMMRQKSGSIINVASVAGLYGNPGQINYSASKAAVIGMTKTAAKELGARGIRVNAIAPGFIKTAMTDALSEDLRKAMISVIALRRAGTVDEIAGVVSFLASDNASYVTGQTIEISGGLSM